MSDASLRLEVNSARLNRLYDYWDGRRVGRPMPSRADIDPVDIPHLLPHIMLLAVDHDAGPRFRVQLIGSAVIGYRANLSDANPTGRWLDEMGMVSDPEENLALCRRATEEQAPAYTSSPCRPSAEQVTEGVMHRIVLPLTVGGNRVDMLLCGVERAISWASMRPMALTTSLPV